jgi:uncharacterized protein (DUF885 family)
MRRRLNLGLSVLCLAPALACGGSSAPPPGTPPPVTAAAAPAKRPAAAGDPSSRVLAVSDAIVDDVFEQSPESVAMLRPPGARYDGWPDASLAALEKRQAREDAWRAELASVDRASLGTDSAKLAYDVAIDILEARKQARVCKNELWDVRPMSSVMTRLADVAGAQPVGTPDLRRQALARFALVPSIFDAQIANLKEGQQRGYLQAEVNVRQVIEQTERLLQTTPEASPFFGPALRDADPELRAKLKELVEKAIFPAIGKYRDYLKTEYLPHARKAFGVSANPHGAECYLASIRQYTTLPRTPQQVHDAGLAELTSLEAEMTALSKKSFGGADLKTLRDRFTTAPEYRQKDAQAIVAQANATIARAKAAMPRAFGIQPPADVVVEPIPQFQERSAAAHYLRAALDGSRPGTYRIRLYKPEEQPIVLGESTAFHEAIPGHHLQVNIATTRENNPRIARFVFNSGYGEGWALYAERLADELGLYSNDASRFGMLSNAAWRAGRLVVDTGIHAFGWDRERAISFLLDHTAMPRTQAAQEVDRYISWPGQATAYMTGYLEIARLRRDAKQALGDKFDLKAFHDCVLASGAVPLPVLARRVEAWVKERGG